jgi:hypothetical protein
MREGNVNIRTTFFNTKRFRTTIATVADIDEL